LPASHQTAIAGLPMGTLVKLALAATGPDRLDLPASCSLRRQVNGMLAPVVSSIAWLDGAPYVTGFIGGPNAEALLRQGPEALLAFAMEQMRELFGSRADATLRPALVADWTADPWQRGAYAYALVGHAGARGALAEPLAGGRLVFAGEACRTDGLAGTVAGAFLDGERAAAAVG
jgi:monoamine oxidase